MPDGDLKVISAPLDFLGFSYYSRWVVAAAETNNEYSDGDRQDIGAAGPLDASVERLLKVGGLPPDRPTTGLGWAIAPDGMRRMLNWVTNRTIDNRFS